MSSVIKLQLLGQSIWYDNIKRSMISDGTFRSLIERREIYGVTSNPSIFQEAITTTKDYDTDLQTMSLAGLDANEMFYRLAIEDIKNVTDLFRPYYEATNGADGFVSLEVDPNLAHDTDATVQEAKWLWKEVDRPNLMVKIPATKEGLPAITESIAFGINVNITLIFSRKRYVEVMNAYLAGLEKRLNDGKDIKNISSVASFFVSRLETKADERLQCIIEEGGDQANVAKALKGKIAVDNTRLAYLEYERIFASDRFKKLAEHGAQKQRPLWASTSTKDPQYNDIKYVEELIAENTVNTVPPNTLEAFLDHGDPVISIYDDLDRARRDFDELESLGILIDEITQELEDEGVQKFADSFIALIDSINDKQHQYLMGYDQLTDQMSAKVNTFKTENIISRFFFNDPTLWVKSDEEKALIQKRLGWLSLPTESAYLIPDLNSFAECCKADGFEKVLLMGMGGSSLAPETLSLLLGEAHDGLSLHVLDSTIPEQVQTAEDWVDYERTLFIVASKSGTTTETLSLFHYFWSKSKQLLGDTCSSHFVAITDPGTSLSELGESLGFRAVFTANPNVGGRYSALTHFGLVPAALLGVDMDKFLDCAVKISKKCSPVPDFELNPGAILGILLGLSERNEQDKLTILTDQGLTSLGAWLEQLVAESSGKTGKGIVPVADEPIMEVTDYGSDRIFVYLRETGESDRFVEQLQEAEHSVYVINIQDRYDLAAQFFLWEFAVAIACSVIGVNAFDQPDVQDSKDRTKQKLNAYLEDGQLEQAEVIWQKDDVFVYGQDFAGLDDCGSIAEVIDKFSGLSQRGDYIALNAFLPRNEKNTTRLQALREKITKRTGKATTLGFGPRFLHSTGQLHKGGANNGLFIQITQEDAKDLAIPEKDYTFGVLARAQADGDLEALFAQNRRAIRIHVPVDFSFEW